MSQFLKTLNPQMIELLWNTLFGTQSFWESLVVLELCLRLLVFPSNFLLKLPSWRTKWFYYKGYFGKIIHSTLNIFFGKKKKKNSIDKFTFNFNRKLDGGTNGDIVRVLLYSFKKFVYQNMHFVIVQVWFEDITLVF